MRNKLICLVIGIFLVLQVGFVSCADDALAVAQDSGLEVIGDSPIYSGEGNLESGKFQVGENQEIGDLVDKSAKPEEIVVSDVEFMKDKTGSTFTYNKVGGSCEIYGEVYENIKSQKEAGHPSFVKLDKDGEVINADFTTNKDGVYVFEGTEINVTNGSRITYSKEKGVVIHPPEGSEIKEFPKMKEGYKGKIPDVTFKGKNILFPEGNKLVNGAVKLNSYGLVLDKDTEFIYKNELHMYSKNNDFLIANKDISYDKLVKDYGSFFKETDDELIFRNVGEKEVRLDVLEDSEFFGTGENSNLNIVLGKGNELKFNKDENGKIEVDYLTSEKSGSSEIINGKSIFTLDNKNNIRMEKYLDSDAEYESVPMIIGSLDNDDRSLRYASVEIRNSNGDISGYSNEADIKLDYFIISKSIEQKETPTKAAVKVKIEEMQGLLWDGDYYKAAGYTNSRKDEVDGFSEMRTINALETTNIDFKKIGLSPGTVEYYEDIIRELEKEEFGEISKLLEEEQMGLELEEGESGIKLNELGEPVITPRVWTLESAYTYSIGVEGKYSENVNFIEGVCFKGILTTEECRSIRGYKFLGISFAEKDMAYVKDLLYNKRPR